MPNPESLDQNLMECSIAKAQIRYCLSFRLLLSMTVTADVAIPFNVFFLPCLPFVVSRLNTDTRKTRPLLLEVLCVA